MLTFKKFISPVVTSILLLSTVISANAQAGMITETPDYIVNASIDGDSDSIGSISGYNIDDIYVRERKNKDAYLRTASFVQFDLSSFTSSMVNSSAFSVVFEADLVSKLNTINAMEVLIGEIDGHSWDDSLDAGTVPLFEWAAGSLNSKVFADNVNVDPVTFSVDVTETIRSWVNGTTLNNGFVLFGSDRVYQGVAFENAVLRTQVPEPTSIAILALVLIALALVRTSKA